jgi:hypothetical protein
MQIKDLNKVCTSFESDFEGKLFIMCVVMCVFFFVLMQCR